MKKLLVLMLAFLLTLPLLSRDRNFNHSAFGGYRLMNELREEGYTILPEVIVTAYRNDQDTIKNKDQRFSSRYETKGGRGYRLPEWANDSTWTPGSKPPQEKSNYEKYWEEKNGPMGKSEFKGEQKPEFDDLYYNPKTDGQQVKKHKKSYVDPIDQVVDTLRAENPNIEVNYYNYDPFYYSYNIGRFYHGGFNYWHYNPFFYDPWYDDFGWGWNPYYGYNYPYGFGYPYYNSFYFGYNSYWGWNFGWNWGWNSPYYYHPYNNYNHYYGHNGGGYHNDFRNPQYGRRESFSNLSHNSINNRREVNTGTRNLSQERRVATTPQKRPTYSEGRRSYTPSYENRKMPERPLYNNSKVRDNGNSQSMEQRRANMGNMGNMNRGNMGNRSNPVNTRSNTNNFTNRNSGATQNRSYSAPNTRREFSAPTQSRSNFSSPSRSSNSFNSGSSNSGSSFGGGSRSSGGGSGSSGSSGSSSSHGRR